jgi:hypothetical protein
MAIRVSGGTVLADSAAVAALVSAHGFPFLFPEVLVKAKHSPGEKRHARDKGRERMYETLYSREAVRKSMVGRIERSLLDDGEEVPENPNAAYLHEPLCVTSALDVSATVYSRRVDEDGSARAMTLHGNPFRAQRIIARRREIALTELAVQLCGDDFSSAAEAELYVTGLSRECYVATDDGHTVAIDSMTLVCLLPGAAGTIALNYTNSGYRALHRLPEGTKWPVVGLRKYVPLTEAEYEAAVAQEEYEVKSYYGKGDVIVTEEDISVKFAEYRRSIEDRKKAEDRAAAKKAEAAEKERLKLEKKAAEAAAKEAKEKEEAVAIKKPKKMKSSFDHMGELCDQAHPLRGEPRAMNCYYILERERTAPGESSFDDSADYMEWMNAISAKFRASMKLHSRICGVKVDSDYAAALMPMVMPGTFTLNNRDLDLGGTMEHFINTIHRTISSKNYRSLRSWVRTNLTQVADCPMVHEFRNGNHQSVDVDIPYVVVYEPGLVYLSFTPNGRRLGYSDRKSAPLGFRIRVYREDHLRLLAKELPTYVFKEDGALSMNVPGYLSDAIVTGREGVQLTNGPVPLSQIGGECHVPNYATMMNVIAETIWDEFPYDMIQRANDGVFSHEVSIGRTVYPGSISVLTQLHEEVHDCPDRVEFDVIAYVSADGKLKGYSVVLADYSAWRAAGFPFRMNSPAFIAGVQADEIRATTKMEEVVSDANLDVMLAVEDQGDPAEKVGTKSVDSDSQ